jgi:RNA polymerase sigma factor (sigma-70 family)
MVPVVSSSALVSTAAGTADVNAQAPAPRAMRAVPAVSRRLARRRSDGVLAARFAAGDEVAFAILYERHRASVLAVCIGVLGSRHDAEDAAQESFAKLAIALRRAQPDELSAWLARVARNAAIDIARRRRSSTTMDEETPAITAAPSERDGVHDALESVMAGIRELPESQRTALLMRELAGHSYQEIAVLLDTDEDAVRGLIARARVGLRAHREAVELPCASVRAALAAEPDGRRHDRVVRRHIRGCRPCRAWQRALRSDADALRGLVPGPASGVLGGGAIAGGIAAKGALLSGAVAQVTAACAVSVCAVSGIALLDRPAAHHRVPHHARIHTMRSAAAAEPGAGTESAAAASVVPAGETSGVPNGGSATPSHALTGGGQPGAATRPTSFARPQPGSDAHGGRAATGSDGSQKFTGRAAPGAGESSGSSPESLSNSAQGSSSGSSAASSSGQDRSGAGGSPTPSSQSTPFHDAGGSGDVSGSGGSPGAGGWGASASSTGSNQQPFGVLSASGGSIPHDQPLGSPTPGD